MLKALELVGFKSFADKTRFEFPTGITVVVGPNGSGKSNVVDAVKWVLGEQRVKSLRGTEMADVIFNGSGARRAMNSAEITLTLDNANGLLEVDSPEVHITRRVYRSGEGEYLINRQPCRLRDIRDLLSGTGLGTQAYSVIEQGKVDVLLQASPRDRRMIFEEAAGISRFKAKKIEAQRRLERVEQNLLRLSDIVDEVESRLRSVRAQAGKARRYREYTSRLQELRTQVGLVDWSRLSERLAVFEAELASLAERRDGDIAEAEAHEAELLDIETRLGDTAEQIRGCEAKIAANRERIAAQESTIDHQRARCRDLETEAARHRQQIGTMSVRAVDLQQQLHDTDQAVQSAQEHHRQVARLAAQGERDLTEVMEKLDHVRGENEQRRSAHVEKLRVVAALGNEISALENQVQTARTAKERAANRISELSGQLAESASELEAHQRERDRLDEEAQRHGRRLEAARQRLADHQEDLARVEADQAELRQRQSGLAERVSVLEELEQRQEGMTAGAKEVLARRREAKAGVWLQVHGTPADVFQVPVESAPLVDLALGEKAQHVIATASDDLLEALKRDGKELAGRVGFLWLDGPQRNGEPGPDLVGQPGVLGRVEQFVQTEPRYAPLAKRLLGSTWVVETLDTALSLSRSSDGRAAFITLAGELLAADGTLLVGPQQGTAGLISRRSELRALATRLEDLQARIGEADSAAERIRGEIHSEKHRVDELTGMHHRAVEAVSAVQLVITAGEERKTQLTRQRSALEIELHTAEAQHQSASRSLEDSENRRQQLDAELAEMESVLYAAQAEIEDLENQRLARNRQTTDAKVELAKCEERLENLRDQMRQFEENRQERSRALGEGRTQLAQCEQRADQSRWAILKAESEVAELYLKKEGFAQQTVHWIEHREELRGLRSQRNSELGRVRATLRQVEEKLHAVQLDAGEIRHQRNTLADRLREDYGIELAELEHEPSGEEQLQREEVQREIDDLRRKINNLGNVNLEALEELEQLETRHETLDGQYKDLASAKSSLERIIERINTDSRRLFAETLETVKGHFQSLFRDLFGGGQADIVLDEDVDILETGIEIVARPPGKEPRSISLLSGGEKTLTCVALLLAVFRSRPSPFCVLDEVDAALDEANIDRFINVLKDFLTWTQFIIVTHSKRTMTCANSIYGVTMQESGVSKQVSVRFEDVSEDGEILLPQGDDDETQAA